MKRRFYTAPLDKLISSVRWGTGDWERLYSPNTSFNKWAMSDVHKQLMSLKLLANRSRN